MIFQEYSEYCLRGLAATAPLWKVAAQPERCRIPCPPLAPRSTALLHGSKKNRNLCNGIIAIAVIQASAEISPAKTGVDNYFCQSLGRQICFASPAPPGLLTAGMGNFISGAITCYPFHCITETLLRSFRSREICGGCAGQAEERQRRKHCQAKNAYAFHAVFLIRAKTMMLNILGARFRPACQFHIP